MSKQQGSATTSIDPVCGMRVDIEDARQNGLTAQYEGAEYPFCCQGCLSTFEGDPKKYHDQASAHPAE